MEKIGEKMSSWCVWLKGKRGRKRGEAQKFSPNLPKLYHSNIEWKHERKCVAIFWTRLPRPTFKTSFCPFLLRFFCHSISFQCTKLSFFSFFLFFVLILSSVFYFFFTFLLLIVIFSFLLAHGKVFLFSNS